MDSNKLKKKKDMVTTTNENGFGPRKTVVILAVVAGCFAVLWPKIFYPMLLASFVPPSPTTDSTGKSWNFNLYKNYIQILVYKIKKNRINDLFFNFFFCIFCSMILQNKKQKFRLLRCNIWEWRYNRWHNARALSKHHKTSSDRS